jgi:uncharacterized protein YqeY
MLRDDLKLALNSAMKAKEKRATSTLRLIMAAIKDRDIAAREKNNNDGVDETEILGLLQKMVKQRRESIEIYIGAGRTETAQQEGEEIEVIERFLPRAMSEEEMQEAVNKTIADTGASSVKDMGQVMASLRATFTGQMDFGKASGMIKTKLCQKNYTIQ